MELKDMVKEAMAKQIVTIGYENRMNKIAADGIDDIANIDYTNVVQDGRDRDGMLTKQAADETITREIRRQIVLAGYENALKN